MSKLNEALAKALKPKKQSTDDKMRAAGYLPAAEVADKLGMHLGSVYRWVEENQVQSTKALGNRYIKQSSIVEKLGLEQAQIFGFISADAAKKATEKKS